MFILFDSNIWISQLGLRSKDGTAVRFFARRHNAKIAIPEIVELEIEEILTQRMLESRRRMENDHRQLLFIFKKLTKPRLPSEDKIREAVANIIPDFDVPVRRIPLNLEVSRSSMLKSIRKTPPSKKKEQFRDGAIWAHCLELLSEGDVYFVTEDPDFYENGVLSKGLANELVQEMKDESQDNQVFIKRNLSELLAEIKVPFELSKHQVFDSIFKLSGENIGELLNSNGFSLVDGMEGDINCFATEVADKVYFTFELEQNCQDFTQKGRSDGVLIIKGSGFVDTETEEITDVKISNILLNYPEWQPGGPPRGAVFVSTKLDSLSQLTVRLPLDSPENDS